MANHPRVHNEGQGQWVKRVKASDIIPQKGRNLLFICDTFPYEFHVTGREDITLKLQSAPNPIKDEISFRQKIESIYRQSFPGDYKIEVLI